MSTGTTTVYLALLSCLIMTAGCANRTTPSPETIALREMCDELERKLFRDPAVRSFLIYPRCEPGRVTLNGSVRDYEGWEEAGRIAASMPGVRQVQNNLRILEQDGMYPDVD